MQCTIIFYTKRKILAKLSGGLQPQKENAEAGLSTERLQQSIFLFSLIAVKFTAVDINRKRCIASVCLAARYIYF